MIDEKRLYEMAIAISCAEYIDCGDVRGTELLETLDLARLGLWARDVAVPAMSTAQDHCLCTRNTYGFDYSEIHPHLGKPGPGKRWLTPNDVINDGLAKLPKEEGK